MVGLHYEALLLFFSLGILGKSAEVVVESASKLTKFFGISQMALGFLLVSTLTSLPELTVSVIAASSGNIGISIGNVIGANITNICMVMGIVAIMKGVKIKKEDYLEIATIMFLTSIIALVLLLIGEFGSIIGAVLIGIFVYYGWKMLKRKKIAGNGINDVNKPEALNAFVKLIVSIFIVLMSANVAVNAVKQISTISGLDQTFIGATIVSLGTTLPELMVSIIAVSSGNPALAIGTAIGSCMTNITLILGFGILSSTTVVNIPIYTTLVIFLLSANITFFFIAATERKLETKSGIALIMLYLLFIIVSSGVQISELVP